MAERVRSLTLIGEEDDDYKDDDDEDIPAVA